MAKELKIPAPANNQFQNRYPGAVPLHGGAETYKWQLNEPLEGIYLSLQDGSLGGKMVRIQTGNGVETASAPITLARALEGVKTGTKVAIIWTGTQRSKSRKDQKTGQPVDIKVFEVYAIK